MMARPSEDARAGCRFRGQVAVRPSRGNSRPPCSCRRSSPAAPAGSRPRSQRSGGEGAGPADLVLHPPQRCRLAPGHDRAVGSRSCGAGGSTGRARWRWTPRGDRIARRVVSVAVGATGVVLVGLTLLSFFANRTLAGIGDRRPSPSASPATSGGGRCAARMRGPPGSSPPPTKFTFPRASPSSWS